jgi:hypothetical protein
MGLVGGVLGLNLAWLVVGGLILAGPLSVLGLRARASYAGVALLVGAGATGVVMHAAVVAGARATLATFAAVTIGLATAGLLLRAPLARLAPAPAGAPPRGPVGRAAGVLEALGIAALAGILALTVFAAFRTAPFLDDTWTLWVPRGLALESFGLDARLFEPNARYATLAHPDYPLWWSLALALDLRFVGDLDLRAASAQTAILVAAFFAAVARLLWGRVRPWVLWPALALLAASPELLRQIGSGGADLALAVFLVTFVLAAAIWVAAGDPLALMLAGILGSVALLVKSEGAPQLAILLLSVTVLGAGQPPRRLLYLWGAVAAAFAAAAPWFVWRAAHGATRLSDISLTNATDPGYLLDRSDRVGPAAETLLRHVTSPSEWLIVVPLLVAASVGAAVKRRAARWLGALLPAAALFAFWVWVNWADPSDLAYRLGTSSYRVIDALMLLAGVLVAVCAEALANGPAPRDASSGAAVATAGAAP